MPQEQILTELDPAFGDPQIAAIAEQKPIAVLTANDIPDHATDDRRARRSQDHGGDVEIVLGSSNDRSNDEDRLSGERQADAFQADETGDDEQAVLRRERKRRLEAAGAYRDAGRDDLATGEEFEAELISGYLPPELSEEDLKAIVERAVRESGAESAKDMGVAMKQAMAAVDGRADGKRVSGLVRASLPG